MEKNEIFSEFGSKAQTVIGTTTINLNRNLPWARATHCLVCKEMRPTPQKSIRLEAISVTNQAGETVTLHCLYLLRELCIRRRICKNHCLLEGDATIEVYSR